MIALEIKGSRVYLIQVRNGYKMRVASFPAEGYKWWKELMGVDKLDDSFVNYEHVAKAFIFAKVYSYAKDKAILVKILKEMDKYEAIYWMYAITRDGMRAVSAFKKLFSV